MLKVLTLVLVVVFLIIGFRWFIVPRSIHNNWKYHSFEESNWPSTPNFYASCPPSMCKNSERVATSPVFFIPVDLLKKRWQQMIEQQPRTSLIAEKETGNSYGYVQLSAFFNFPDLITVKFIAIDKHHSSLYIYSKSIFGHYDFNVNQKRVQQWLDGLNSSKN